MDHQNSSRRFRRRPSRRRRSTLAAAALAAALVGAALAGTTATSEAASANSCSNPALATNLNGWGALDAGTVSRVAVTDPIGANWAFATTGRAFWMPQVSVAAGQQWTVSARDRLMNGSGTAKITVEWYSGSGVYLSESAGSPATLSSTTWTPVSATVTVPSGAVTAHVLQEGAFGAAVNTSWRTTLCDYRQGTVTTAPSAPITGTPTTGATSATLTWSPPTDTGGSAITGYTYGRDGTDSQGTGPWSGTTGASTRSATFNLLQPGTTYHLWVAATNAIGTGPRSSVTVVVPSSGGSSPSNLPMPTGDLPDWRQVFTEDFTSTVALGSWPGPYASKWADYTYPGSHDTNGGAEWNTVKDVSASGGTADYYLHSENGKAFAAALLPRTAAQTYGRYEVRFKVDPGMTGWKSAWLLWPDDEVWPDHGEIDWPEGDLTGTMDGFMHHADPDGDQDSTSSQVPFAPDWHTATTEWLPDMVKYYLDGHLVDTFTNAVSSYPMHWVLQSESGSSSRPTGSGHIKIDWAVIYTRA
jgi:hypothetical protein